MRLQTLFHLALLGALTAVGVWIVRVDLDPRQAHLLGEWSGIAAAFYGFVALSFALISTLWLMAGRRRGWLYLFSGYLLSAAVAGAAGWFVLQAGRDAVRGADDPNRIELPRPAR
jgi:hypothetical protein